MNAQVAMVREVKNRGVIVQQERVVEGRVSGVKSLQKHDGLTATI